MSDCDSKTILIISKQIVEPNFSETLIEFAPIECLSAQLRDKPVNFAAEYLVKSG